MALTDIVPITRNEAFLEDIAEGNAEATLDPIVREEEFLRRIAVFNATEKAAFMNIYDKIPVDPESTDVGKVMTVIADTSGEEPVYKWSAEDAPAGMLSLVYNEAQVTGSSAPYGQSGPQKANVTGWDNFSTDFEALKTNYEKLNEYLESHIHFYYCGIRVHFRATANLTDAEHSVNGEKVVLSWLCKDGSDNAVPVILVATTKIHSNLAAATYAVQLNVAAYNHAGTQISSGLSNTTDCRTNYKLLVYR